MSLTDRNRIEMALLGPIFGMPSATLTAFGVDPQTVAMTNQLGMLAWDIAGSGFIFRPKSTRGLGKVDGGSTKVVETESLPQTGRKPGLEGPGPNALEFSGGPPNVVLNTKAIQDLAVGVLPGKPIGGPGTPREMPTTSDPTRTAEDFATQLFGGGSIDKIPLGPKCIGCWRAQTSDGAWVTYRPAGQASSHTSPTTATVEVNGPRINAINVKTTGEAEILKLKFPVVSEVP